MSKILIIDNHITEPCNACYAFRKNIHSGYRVIVRAHDNLPKTFHRYSHIILTGGAGRIDTGDPSFLHLKKFILAVAKEQIPLLGICYGHQAIAVSLGSETFLTNYVRPTMGWIKIRRTGKSRLLNNLPKKFYSYEHHHSHVNRLPAGFIQIATSRRAKIEGFEHKTLPIFGIQFHPDISHRKGVHLFKEQVLERMPRGWLVKHKRGRPPFAASVNKKIFSNFYNISS